MIAFTKTSPDLIEAIIFVFNGEPIDHYKAAIHEFRGSSGGVAVTALSTMTQSLPRCSQAAAWQSTVRYIETADWEAIQQNKKIENSVNAKQCQY